MLLTRAAATERVEWMTERYGGDVPLAAEGTFYSTVFSLLTVPAMFCLIQRFGL
jgi:predicted permease